MNYFSPNTAALRYSKGRPNFHNLVIQRIKTSLNLNSNLNTALDIACGTGLSTQALLSIANSVYGTDISQAMLELALQKDKINYQLAPANNQPFENEFFDLITVCSGVHWLDIDNFLLEANRLLKNNSWLILYDNFFLGEMEGNPNFKFWFEAVYLNKFPPPSRHDKYNWSQDNLLKYKFDFVLADKFDNSISFNKKDLILYFTTQSNIIALVEKGVTSYEQAEHWLTHQLNVFFDKEDDLQIIRFGNWIKYLKKHLNK